MVVVLRRVHGDDLVAERQLAPVLRNEATDVVLPLERDREAGERTGDGVAGRERVRVRVDGEGLLVPGHHVDTVGPLPDARDTGHAASRSTDTDRPRSRCRGRSPGRRSRGLRSWCLLAWGRRGHERGRTVMEAPACAVTVEHVVVAADKLNVPAGVTHEDEDHITRRGRLVITPGLDDRVEDEVALGATWRPLRVRLTEASCPTCVPMPGMTQTPSGQKVATTSSVLPSSSAWVYTAKAARTPSETSANVVVLTALCVSLRTRGRPRVAPGGSRSPHAGRG